MPAQDSAKDRQYQQYAGQNDPFQLLVSRATLAEIRMASRDKRPVQFLFDEKGNPKGTGQLDSGDGWETGRDQDFDQFEKDVTHFLIEQFESLIGDYWKQLHNGKSFRDSFEQANGSITGDFDRDVIKLIEKVVEAKAKKAAREINDNGFECNRFTFYFLIKASPWLTEAENAKQNVVLNKLREPLKNCHFE